MNILILSTEFPPGPGGIGEHAFQLARNLQSMEWQVTVITRQDYTNSPQQEAFNHEQPFSVVNLPEITSPIRDAIHRWRVLLHQIRVTDADILLVTGLRSVWLSSILLTRMPVVAIGHGTEFGVQKWQFLLTRFAFQRASHVVCVSNFTQRFMLNRNIYPKNATIIHNGADETKYFPLSSEEITQFRQKLGFSSQQKILLTVGSVTERKGQEVVIRSLPDILQKVPNTHYLIAGMPILKEKLEALSQQLGVLNHVHFLGRLTNDELIRAYNTCDLFVMTSRHTQDGDFEGYGIAVIEAALCGKTSVVAANSGLAEAVLDQETGIVVTENDPASTAETIISLLQDDALRSRLGSNARTHALQDGTWSKRVAQYDKLFRRLASL